MREYTERINRWLRNPQLYRYSPQLYAYYYAADWLNRTLETAPASDGIAVWGGGIHTAGLFSLLFDENKDKIAYVIDNFKKEDECGLGKPFISVVELEQAKIDTIIVSGFNSRLDIKGEIAALQKSYRVIDLYDVLQSKNFDISQNIFEPVDFSYYSIREALVQLSDAKTDEEEKIAVKKLIGEYFHIRDFQNAFRYIALLRDSQDEEAQYYVQLKENIEKELASLKQKLDGTEHIVVNWIDNLRADELCHMPFLSQLKEHGVFFDNAHTVAPYTSPVMKAIFRGELYLDGKLFEIPTMNELEDSELYRVIVRNGYAFSYIGCKCLSGRFFNNSKTYAFFRFGKTVFGTATALLQWKLLEELDGSVEKRFIIVHNTAETHPPCINGVQKDFRDINENVLFRVYKNGRADEIQGLLDQIEQSERYLDEQFDFYYHIYENVRYHIFMSDHGMYRGEKPICFRGYTHIVFFVLGRGAHACHENRLLSLVRFPQIIECLMNDEPQRLRECTDDYVFEQSDDAYAPRILERYHANPEAFMAKYVQHRGIISMDDSYLHLLNGEEYYFKKGNRENLIDDPAMQERISELRKLCGNTYIDVNKYDKYTLSKEMYEEVGLQIDPTINFFS